MPDRCTAPDIERDDDTASDCPRSLCKGALRPSTQGDTLICSGCGIQYDLGLAGWRRLAARPQLPLEHAVRAWFAEIAGTDSTGAPVVPLNDPRDMLHEIKEHVASRSSGEDSARLGYEAKLERIAERHRECCGEPDPSLWTLRQSADRAAEGSAATPTPYDPPVSAPSQRETMEACAQCGHAEDDHDGYGGLCGGLGANVSRTVCGCPDFVSAAPLA